MIAVVPFCVPVLVYRQRQVQYRIVWYEDWVEWVANERLRKSGASRQTVKHCKC